MAHNDRVFSTVQDPCPELEEELSRLSIGSASAYPMPNSCRNRPAESVAQSQVTHLVLKNEICDLFRVLYKEREWGLVLDSGLVAGRRLPMLELIASRIKFDVAEELLFMSRSPSFDSTGSNND
nr:uncharacterized protein LOC113707738 [Coffea arabica]